MAAAGSFFEMHFVDEVFHSLVAESIDILGEQYLNMAAADITEFLRQGIKPDTLNCAGAPLECVVREQWPATEQAPSRHIRVRLHHLLDFGYGVLRGFFMVEDIEQFDASMFFCSGTKSSGALL